MEENASDADVEDASDADVEDNVSSSPNDSTSPTDPIFYEQNNQIPDLPVDHIHIDFH